MKKQDAGSLHTKAQEAIRIKAVQSVLSGRTQIEVAEIFGVTRQAVGKWIKKYREQGVKALKAKKQGRKKGGKLLPWQAAQTAKIVIDRHPEQLKLPFHLWTRDAVADLIKSKFGIELSRWTIGHYLKRWGFTPQKPVKKAYEQNPKYDFRYFQSGKIVFHDFQRKIYVRHLYRFHEPIDPPNAPKDISDRRQPFGA